MVESGLNSVAYYDRHAQRFETETGSLPMSSLYERFLRYVPAGGRILDAGCGVGRDASRFLDLGYSVVAFDASAEMVRLAKNRVAARAEVLQMRFEEVAWTEEFAGIWACASLLHVPASELSATVIRLAAALRRDGIFYMSFKYGSGTRVAAGRRFTDQTPESLEGALRRTGLHLLDIWTTTDVRAGRTGECWLNAIAIRDAQIEPIPATIVSLPPCGS